MTYWQWHQGRLQEAMPPSRGTLLVADSFLVRSGRIRGARLHNNRFLHHATSLLASLGDPVAEVPQFLSQSGGLICDVEDSFPRLELWAGTAGRHLAFRTRDTPALGTEVHLKQAGSDPRISPSIKGPNIKALTALGIALGGEPLLLSRTGDVAEGGTSSLLWWQGTTLHASSISGRVSSVTERLVLGIASSLGHPIAQSQIRPRDLARHEVWAVNALHGIRRVSAINQTQAPAPAELRLRSFRDRLDQTWESPADW